MAETNKSKMMSEAEIIEAINADTLVSVSLGEGQPQKNVKLSTLASVVAGNIGLDGNVYFKYRGNCSNPDNATNSGHYDYSNSSSAIGGSNYGRLLCFYNAVFPTTWAWGVQFFLGDNNTFSYRTSIRKSGEWTSWRTLSQ